MARDRDRSSTTGSGSADLRGGLLSRSGGRGSQSPSDDRSRRVPSPPSQGVDSRDEGSRELFRGGRRARHRADPERRNAEDRKIDAAELLGVYGVVSRTQVVQASFGGNAFSANRLLKRMESDGFIESRNSGAGRYGYSVLALTPTGVSWLERQRKRRRKSSDRVSDPEQRLVSGFGDGRQLQHDQRVFEAVQADVGQEVSRGSRVKRVRLDPELKGLLASASESARVKGGRPAARSARAACAGALGLRVMSDGSVPLPDALVELEHSDGRVESRGIEVGSSAYTGKQISEKRDAGFRFYMPRSPSMSGTRSERAPSHSGVAFALDWGRGGGGR